MKYTVNDFHKEFPDDDACLDRILALRFGPEPVCPHCNKKTKFHRITGRKQYACQFCGHHVAPCAGTVFAKSPTPLKSWFYAMYLYTSSRHGVPAKELQRQLGVTYKCAWRMAHQLRDLMAQADHNTDLGGIVEIDETYIGGKTKLANKRGDRLVNKTPILGMTERQGRVRTDVIPVVRAKQVTPTIKKHVLPGTEIHTDEGAWYRSLKRRGYKHHVVNHAAKEYVRGADHVNSIEGFWSRLKSSIKGTHIHVSPKYLHKYANEFAFRYNSRQAPGLMFERVLAGLVKPRRGV